MRSGTRQGSPHGPMSRRNGLLTSTFRGSTDVGWMDDEQIEAALSQVCCVCAAGIAEECIDPISGQPWLEIRGYPVHLKRCEP